MKWISSKDFLAEYKFTKMQTWAHIENGRMVPYDQGGGRVFPTDELNQLYCWALVSLRKSRYDLQRWLDTSTAETDYEDVERMNRVTSSSGTVVTHEDYTAKRERKGQEVFQIEQRIRELETLTDRANAWKNHELTPAQEEELFDKFYFSSDDVQKLTATGPSNQEQKNAGSPKDSFRAYAKAIIDSGDIPTRTCLAEKILDSFPDTINPKTGERYDIRTIIDWIRDLFPDFSPLTPGAKRKK